jgi:hypothetical protein
VTVIRTSDAAIALSLALPAAAQTLAALAKSKLVTPIRQGLFWIDGQVDLDRVPEYLTTPLPSYLSLHTALHRRGMIEQIPEVLYSATLARTQRVATKIGSFWFHHLAPQVFGGFEELSSGVKPATAVRFRSFVRGKVAPIRRAAGARAASQVSTCRAARGASPWRAQQVAVGVERSPRPLLVCHAYG